MELDALNWGPSWTPVPRDVLRERVRQAIAGERWVVDGNYSAVRDLVWPRADTVVWLDFPLHVVLARLLRRTARRALLREELWAGNREDLVRGFLSRDSILVWALRTFWRRRRAYPQLFLRDEYRHLVVVCLRTPRQAEAWLRAVAAGTGWAVPPP